MKSRATCEIIHFGTLLTENSKEYRDSLKCTFFENFIITRTVRARQRLYFPIL